MIIFICGTSSSGKSTICQHLQATMPDGWLNFSTDGFLAMLGNKFVGLHPDNPAVCDPNDVCYAKKHRDGTYEIVIGKLCSKLNATIPSVLEMLAKNGFSIIVDSLITTKKELHNFRSALSHYAPLFVYLSVSQKAISERERSRKDRLEGSAIHLLRSFDFQDECDLIIEPEIEGIDGAVNKIRGLFRC